MQKFVRELLTEWRRLDLPFSEAKILIAVSGGADSSSLAYAIRELVDRKKLGAEFIVAHYNHRLRGDAADEDCEWVRSFAIELGFELVSESAEKSNTEFNSNVEERARNLRYGFLRRTAESYDATHVLTGHTMNDQAETFLLNLIRGSGIEGLAAMSPVRRINENSEVALTRPLLNWATRENTEEFAALNNFSPRQDSMNEDLEYKRVRIRKELLPLLKDFNPKIVKNLTNTSRLLQRENELNKELLQDSKVISKLISDEVLRVSDVAELPKPLFQKVLREWLQGVRGGLRQIELVHIEAIENLIKSRKSGKVIELPRFGRVVKENGTLKFEVS